MGPGPSGPAAPAVGDQDFRQRIEAAAESGDPSAVDAVLTAQNAVTYALELHAEVTRLRRENAGLQRAVSRRDETIQAIRQLVGVRS